MGDFEVDYVRVQPRGHQDLRETIYRQGAKNLFHNIGQYVLFFSYLGQKYFIITHFMGIF